MAPTPIAQRFTSPPPPESARTSTSSSPPGTSSKRLFQVHRSSISVKPTDDPFAPPPLGGEEWRISEESSVASLALEGPASTTTKKLERRPSFLRSLLPSTRRSRSSTSLSTASISSPITANPPRVGPLRTTASLVSLSNRNSFASSLRSSTPTMGVFSEQMGGSREGSRPTRFVEPPPTESAKAFAILGGPKKTEGSRNLTVDKRTGVRTSLYTEQDRLAGLGLALTTDETRHVVLDNAHLSLFSSTTGSTEFGNRDTIHFSTTRDTSYSHAASMMPGSVLEEEYDPLKEDGDATSLHRSRRSGDTSRPLPSPIPPLPTFSLSDPSFTGAPRPRPPPPAPLPSIPSKNPSRAFVRRPSQKESQFAQTSPASISAQGPTKTVAVLYLVAGLPKDPATWTVSEMDPSAMPAHAANAVPRFWRPEMLGCTVTGEEAEGLSSLDGARVKGKPRATRVAPVAVKEFVTLTKEEVARVQGKVTKLAFNRDVEILASTVQPPSTIATFAFTIPSSQHLVPPTAFSGSTALAWDATVAPTPTSTTSTTFYASCLTVWSHADAVRSDAIRATIEGGGRAKSSTVRRAAKAASAGRKLGQKLSMHMSSPMGAVVSEGRSWGGGVYSDTEGEDGFTTESEWGEAAALTAPLAPLPTSTPFWLPYSLILVSHAPIYNLLNDLLRISWARYHQDIASHSLHMHAILHFPVPKPGERISLPVSAEISQADTFFVATMPGSLDWSTGAAANQNFPFWPLFRALDPANFLTIAEVALSPLGRILFISSHPVMLGLATVVFQFILELRGWRGVVHSTVHARDLKIFIEDPGPYLIAIPSESRAAALADLPPEVAVVDIDSNLVTIKAPQPGALSSGSAREKARRRLEAAIGQVGGAYYGVPAELTEAFPAGRFRPFSEVEVRGVSKEAERLRPAASWDWDQARVISELDAILAAAPRTTLLSKFLRKKTVRRIPELEPGARHVQSLVRTQASTFVDRRDVLEQKINRLNVESAEWQRSFDVFKAFSEKLTKESVDLKTRLEKERREAKRLTGEVTMEKERQARLEASLQATETAREQALLQLSKVQTMRSTLEQQRNLLVAEIGAVLAADESSPLYEVVYQRIEALSHRSDTSSRPGTSMSIRSTTRIRRSSSVLDERALRSVSGNDDEDFKVTELSQDEGDEEEKLEAMKAAVHETLRSIQSRLAIVLENAGQLDPSTPAMDFVRSRSVSMCRYSLSGPPEDDTMRLSTNSHTSSLASSLASGLVSPLSDTPPSSAFPSPSQDDIDEATDRIPSTLTRPHEPRRFKPRAFQLSPPMSPDDADADASSSFHTSRTSLDQSRSMRRRSQRGHSGNNDSIFSLASFREGSAKTPFPATPDRTFSHSRSPSQLSRSTSYRTYGVRDDGVFGTPASRMSNYPDDDDASFVSARSESQGWESPRSDEDDSDSDVDERAEGVPRDSTVEGSVELFTRSGSVLGRRLKESIDLGRVEARTRLARSKLPRPASSATVTGTR